MYNFFLDLWKRVGWVGFIAVVVSACLMTMEMVAGRLLAPFVGVSIVPWASVIAMVFVSMAGGYGIVGIVMQRGFSLRTMGGGLLIAAIWIGNMNLLASWMGTSLAASSFSLGWIALILGATLLCVPTFLLAAVHPVLIAYLVQDVASFGKTVGTLNACAAIGSIIGTFGTGFILLMWFSLPAVLGGVAGLLLVVAIGMMLRRVPLTAKVAQGSTESRRMKPAYLAFAWMTGFVLMAIEVVAARALAPQVGVSIFTWTAIIGAVLLGITLGNVLGGIIADKDDGSLGLGQAIAWAGVAIVVATCFVEVGAPTLGAVNLPLPLRTVLFALVAFLPPALIIATIGPQLVRVATSHVEDVGKTAGILSAWNTFGGLVGALTSGFWLISWMGTRVLLTSLAVLLILVGWGCLWPQRPWNTRLSVLLAVFFLIQLFLPRACFLESHYYCIVVINDVGSTSQNPGYILRLDHLVHSYVHPLHPETLGYGYEQVYAHLIALRHTQKDPFSSLFIGGGGYVLPRYLEASYPFAKSVVAEIDPKVTETSYLRFGLSRNTTIETANVDARMYLSRSTKKQPFEFVFGDAFNDFSVPYHLTTVEFHRLLKTHMSTDGVYALNIIDDARYGQFLSAMVRTLQVVWKQVYVAPGAANFAPGRNTIVLIATDKEIDPIAWKGTMSPAAQAAQMNQEEYTRLTQLISHESVQAFLRGHPVPILTDAFAPTDRYLAPVFSDAY